MKSTVKFNLKQTTPAQIMAYYDASYKALELKRDRDLREKYATGQERNASFETACEELSIEAGFMLLAYIESVFRVDFNRRIQGRKYKDSLSVHFRTSFNRSRKSFTYKLDDIFKGWRNQCADCSEEMEDILRKLPQYFDYRNWIAHGRYWEFKDKDYIRRYRFEPICNLVDEVQQHFSDKLKELPRTGEARVVDRFK